MSVFYELGINWYVIYEDIFEEWLHMVSSFTTVRQRVKLLSKHLSVDLSLIAKKV